MNEEDKQKIWDMTTKKNHRVLVVVTQIPSIGLVSTEYLSHTKAGIAGVSRSRHGVVFLLANGANITFTINMPFDTSKYQLVIDDRKGVS